MCIISSCALYFAVHTSLNLSCIALFLDATNTTTICASNTATFSAINHESGKILPDCYFVILKQPSLKDLPIFMIQIQMLLFLPLKPMKGPTPPPTNFPNNFPTPLVSCVVIPLHVFGSQINVSYIFLNNLSVVPSRKAY